MTKYWSEGRCGTCIFGMKMPKEKDNHMRICYGGPPHMLIIPTPPQMVPGPTPDAAPRMVPPGWQVQNGRSIVSVEELACSFYQRREQEEPFEIPPPPEAAKPQIPILVPAGARRN